jgi:hypothetical protein
MSPIAARSPAATVTFAPVMVKSRLTAGASRFFAASRSNGMTCSQFGRQLCAIAGYFLPQGEASNSSRAFLLVSAPCAR